MIAMVHLQMPGVDGDGAADLGKTKNGRWSFRPAFAASAKVFGDVVLYGLVLIYIDIIPNILGNYNIISYKIINQQGSWTVLI